MAPSLARYIAITAILASSFLGGALSDFRIRLSRAIRLALYTTIAALGGISLLHTVPGIDELQGAFLLLIGIVAMSVTLASEGYSRVLFGISRPLQVLIDPALGLLVLFFLSRNLLELTIMWIGVELIGFFLILFEKREEAWRSALRFLALCVTMGDISLFTWVALASLKLGLERALLSDFSTLAVTGIRTGPVATVLLVIGFVTKMALVPLHFWLPDAHSIAPAPASAILSGVMTSMGLYALLRVWETVSLSAPVFTGMLVIQGFLSVVYASLMAAAQTNIKRILAYSTIMHCGVMALLAALLPYSGAAVKILALYALFHGISKAQLFVNTGSVYILTNTIDVHRLGYLARTNPELYRATILGASSFMALPPTLGFAVKALLIYVAFEVMSRGGIYSLLFLLAVAISSVFGIVYVVKYIGIYVGSLKEPRRPTIRLPSTLVFAEQVLGWSVVALVPLVMTIMVNWFVNLLMLIYLVSAALLIYSLYIKAPRVVPFDDVWLGGVAP